MVGPKVPIIETYFMIKKPFFQKLEVDAVAKFKYIHGPWHIHTITTILEQIGLFYEI